MPMAPAPMTMMSFGCSGKHHRLLAANDAGSIERKTWHLPADDTRGDEDILALDFLLLSVLVGYLHDTCLGNRGSAADIVDLVLLEEHLDAASELVGDLSAAADDLVPLEAYAFHLQAKVGGMMGQELIHFRILKERFGGDAAPVKARPTGAIHLHTRHLLTELPRANRSHISGRSAANDNQIIIGHNIILVSGQNDQNLAPKQ